MGIVKDIDGNVYKTVKIGNQIWTAENLKVTRLNDGSPILNITDDQEWSSTDSPAYCNYNNDPANKDNYGTLYNFFAVETGLLAPKGWHVATDKNWNILIGLLPGKGRWAGKLLKSQTGWLDDGNGKDDFGFSALPGGYRYCNFLHSGIGHTGFWWCFPAYGNSGPKSINMNGHRTGVRRFTDSERNFGQSIRLVRD